MVRSFEDAGKLGFLGLILSKALASFTPKINTENVDHFLSVCQAATVTDNCSFRSFRADGFQGVTGGVVTTGAPVSAGAPVVAGVVALRFAMIISSKQPSASGDRLTLYCVSEGIMYRTMLSQ